jgi:hypothetical protein
VTGFMLDTDISSYNHLEPTRSLAMTEEPLLMITHLVAFYFLGRPSGQQAAE